MNDAERRIRAYEEMGDHRTGREADNAATDWMIAELAAVGVQAQPQEWTFPQVDWNDACVRLNGANVPGVPLFDGALESVSGRLAEPGSAGIVVSQIIHGDSTQFSTAMYPHLDSLVEQGANAVVLVMGDPDGNHAIRNAEFPRDPRNLAVLQVAPNDAGPVLIGAAEAHSADLVIDGWRETKTAANVVASVAGTDPSAEPVTLMTPKSGWYTCAAERGGGIAIWMEVAGRIAGNPGRRTLNLVASSGHELHHLGLDHYIHELGDAAHDVHAWMHLGASIGSRNGQAAYAGSDDELFNVATNALNAQGLERRAFPVGNAGFGEARNIGEINGRFASFLGGHPYFHSPLDTYDRCVDSESLARHTDAAEQIVRYMLR
ncbi:MAG: hypothetical protein F4X58_13120 [Chloroflexi bacterium]|nr:hypothetical protein [Chloroflexota bacterium]MYC02849.1 hypothetical protein [Chloroflexota bacterium]